MAASERLMRNPAVHSADPTRTTAGSTSGSAAVVAAGLVCAATTSAARAATDRLFGSGGRMATVARQEPSATFDLT